MPSRITIYAGFMQRLGAFFIDAGLLFFIYAPFHFYNIIEAKSFYLFVFYQLLWMLYKPFCEFFWGQTIGKAALRIKVYSADMIKLSFGKSFFRNVLFMMPAISGFYFYQSVFSTEKFLNIQDYFEFQEAFILEFPLFNVLYYSIIAIILLDSIYLMFFGGVKEKSLHDKWAGTVVINLDH